MSNTRTSKAMTYYLRHNLDKFKTVNSAGYVKLNELLSLLDASRDEVSDIVKQCNKQRFHILENKGEFYIRANQGHSKSTDNIINPEDIYEEITEPLDYCAHGTFKKHVSSIMKQGLNRMERSFIHFASSSDAISGKRTNNDVLIHIDMRSAMEDGIKFYLSKNNVILSEGIDGVMPPKYMTCENI